MAVRAYWIEGPWKGRLAIVPRPRGGDWLTDELSDWREIGIDTVVSLLTDDEVVELDLEREGPACQVSGIRFLSFPIPDRGVPASQVETERLLKDLGQELKNEKKVALHCRQSVGRSALIAASLLVEAGEEPHRAFEQIGLARGVAVPETAEQERWVVDRALMLVGRTR